MDGDRGPNLLRLPPPPPPLCLGQPRSLSPHEGSPLVWSCAQGIVRRLGSAGASAYGMRSTHGTHRRVHQRRHQLHLHPPPFPPPAAPWKHNPPPLLARRYANHPMRCSPATASISTRGAQSCATSMRHGKWICVVTFAQRLACPSTDTDKYHILVDSRCWPLTVV